MVSLRPLGDDPFPNTMESPVVLSHITRSQRQRPSPHQDFRSHSQKLYLSFHLGDCGWLSPRDLYCIKQESINKHQSHCPEQRKFFASCYSSGHHRGVIFSFLRLFSESKSVALCGVFILTLHIILECYGHLRLLIPNLTTKGRSR